MKGVEWFRRRISEHKSCAVQPIALNDELTECRMIRKAGKEIPGIAIGEGYIRGRLRLGGLENKSILKMKLLLNQEPF